MDQGAILQAILELSEQLSNTERRIMKRIDGLETRMDALETRMDALETRMDALENRMGALETRVDALETRVNDVETSLKEDIQRLDAKLTVLAEDIISTKTDVKLLQKSQ